VPRSTLCINHILAQTMSLEHSLYVHNCYLHRRSSSHPLVMLASFPICCHSQETNILPIYAEIIGGQPAVSKSTPAVVVAPRSRPVSNVPLGPITKAASSSPTPKLEGLFVVKHSGLFAGWLWKERWLTLTPQAIIIHRRNNKVRAHSLTRRLIDI